jgi:hypothetical protein
MARGFSARRLRPGNPVNTRRHGSKEAIVAHRERHSKPRTLKVRVGFEPSRLSPDWVAQAYERLVPMTRRVIPLTSPPRQLGDARARPQEGRRQA